MTSSSGSSKRHSARAGIVLAPEIYKKFIEDSVRRAELETHPSIAVLLQIEDKIRRVLGMKNIPSAQKVQIVGALVAKFVEAYQQRLQDLTRRTVGDADMDAVMFGSTPPRYQSTPYSRPQQQQQQRVDYRASPSPIVYQRREQQSTANSGGEYSRDPDSADASRLAANTRREEQILHSSMGTPVSQRPTVIQSSLEDVESSNDTARRSSAALFGEMEDEGEEEQRPSPPHLPALMLAHFAEQPLINNTRTERPFTGQGNENLIAAPSQSGENSGGEYSSGWEKQSSASSMQAPLSPKKSGGPPPTSAKSQRDARMRPFLEQIDVNKRNRAKMILDRVLDAPTLDFSPKTGEVIAVNPNNGERVKLVGSNIATVLRKLVTVNRVSTPTNANTYKGILSVLRALARTNFDATLIVNRDFQRQLLDLREQLNK